MLCYILQLSCVQSLLHYHEITKLAKNSMASNGKTGGFNLEEEDWEKYVEMLDCYFLVNEITNKTKRKQYFSVVAKPILPLKKEDI